MSDIQEGCGDLPQRRHARRTGLIAGTALAGIAGMFIAVAPGHATPVTSISMAEETSDVAAFYTPPEDRLVGAHGSVIQLRPIDGDPGVEGARNYLVLYRSVDMRGGSVAVSGTLAVPDGQAPPGGWPLISWAHGTTGVDDSCAPSHDTSPDFPAHDYTSLVRKVQAQWIAAGYAVAQTDYQGLGTPGPHGYLIGTAEQRAVTDMARAAREVDPEIGTRWVAVGHSQGGQAAVFTDAQAQQWAPELQLLGAVALAPASHQGIGLQATQMATTAGAATALAPLTGGGTAFLPLIIRGAQTVTDVDPARFLTPRTAAMVSLADSGCIAQLRDSQEWGGVPPGEVFSPGGDTSVLTRVLNENDPSTLAFSQPLLVLQGRADTTVPALATDAMVVRQRAAGRPVQYRAYPGVDHRGVLEASYADALNWVNGRFGR
ncbi:lipase family protein [Nocardia sp. NBC_01503]|uniref:alpha/beta hydrolase family protein n=1 Tax=Nocardia sp. NBC_01503 TaxID=2975997 RepID=UPI002E7B9A4E|nr:lipase family protein [Nocardia sp. NBC_01503]WTL33641.1 lipase family protein [Nocardia sp. NBC_01503]